MVSHVSLRFLENTPGGVQAMRVTPRYSEIVYYPNRRAFLNAKEAMENPKPVIPPFVPSLPYGGNVCRCGNECGANSECSACKRDAWMGGAA